MFWEGRKIERACKVGAPEIKLSGRPAKWLGNAYFVQHYCKSKGVAVSRVLSQLTNPLLRTDVPSHVIWAVNMLKTFCGFRTMVFIALFSRYELVETGKAYCVIRAAAPAKDHFLQRWRGDIK